MKRALIIRHHAKETLASNFRSVLDARGFELEPLNVFDSAPAYDTFAPPELDQVDLMVVLGGPMSVNDPYPALCLERAYGLAD